MHIAVDLVHTEAPISKYLQPAWSQMSDMPRHSSNGGAGGHLTGRAELYEALNASYSVRPRDCATKK